MPDNERNDDWLDLPDGEPRSPGLPRPDLNPLVNPLLGRNMGRWAQVYFTSPPEQREQAVEDLLQELQAEAAGPRTPASSTLSNLPTPAADPKPMRGMEQPAMPRFTKFKPRAVQTAEQDFVLCPGCLHKNAAEQRFCGICGLPLARVPEPAAGPAPPEASPSSGSPRIESPEPDWQWLRERTLLNYGAANETKNGPKFLVGSLIALVIIAGAYFAWQNRSRWMHEPVSASSNGAETAQAPPSSNLGIPAPTPAVSPPAADAKSTTSAATTAEPPRPSSSTPVASVATSPQAAPAAAPAGGSDELDQGRRYLEGNGVPRNSWMASQWLWKAVAKQNTEAALLLSDLYTRGDGVPRSCEQARVLLVASAKKGSAVAAQKLRSVESGCQ